MRFKGGNSVPSEGQRAHDKVLTKKYVGKWVLVSWNCGMSPETGEMIIVKEVVKVMELCWTTMDARGGPIDRPRIDCVFSEDGIGDSFKAEPSVIKHIFGKNYPSEVEIRRAEKNLK